MKVAALIPALAVNDVLSTPIPHFKRIDNMSCATIFGTYGKCGMTNLKMKTWWLPYA